LRNGAHVVVALDRDVQHTGIEMPFFGATARIPTGPAALSRMTGAPIIIMSLWRTGFRRLEGHVIDPGITIDAGMRGEAGVRAALAPLVRLIEREVMRHPEGWIAAFADDIWVDTAANAAQESVAVGVSTEIQNKI
jgi:phosphatidylinositol dimannoside acyltransferase